MSMVEIGRLRSRRITVNLWWDLPSPKHMKVPPNLIAIMHPTKINVDMTEMGQPQQLDIHVEQPPSWLEPPPIPKPKPVEEQILKSLANEPWTTMLAYADVLEEKGEPLSFGWRMLAENRLYPFLVDPDTYSWNFNSNEPTRKSDVLPAVVFLHDSISVVDVYSTMPVDRARRLPLRFGSVMAAWYNAAFAWTEVEGKQ